MGVARSPPHLSIGLPHLEPGRVGGDDDPGDLLYGKAESEEIGSLASVLLRERKAEQSHLCHLLDDVHGKFFLAVHLLGAGGDHLLGELADRPAELFLLLGEIEVHAGKGNRKLLSDVLGESPGYRGWSPFAWSSARGPAPLARR